jgi:hypothetical protein
VLVDGAGNTLLRFSAQPIFSVLQTNLRRDELDPSFGEHIEHDHRAIRPRSSAGTATPRRPRWTGTWTS